MAIQLFGYPDFPNDIGITKIDIQPNQCAFFLDFNRPLDKFRSYFFFNISFGPSIGLLVPVSHASEQIGGYHISVTRNDPYFLDIIRLWKEKKGALRNMISESEGSGQIIADFGRHFSEDC